MMASSPLYTCIASALMILARRHPDVEGARFMCDARSMASLDFPTPVVPHMATIDLKGTTMAMASSLIITTGAGELSALAPAGTG